MTRPQQYTSHNNNSHGDILIYLNPGTVILKLPFILTQGHRLVLGMPYMVTEQWLADSRTEAIRILDIWDESGIVYIKTQSLVDFKVTTLSWNLEYTSDFWLWSIADLQSIIEA